MSGYTVYLLFSCGVWFALSLGTLLVSVERDKNMKWCARALLATPMAPVLLPIVLIFGVLYGFYFVIKIALGRF